MTEESGPRVTSAESTVSTDSSATKQRRKRKWDQPADTLVAAGVAVPGILPFGNVGSLVGIALPGAAPVSGAGAVLTSPLTRAAAMVPQVLQAPSIQPLVAAVVQKINQPKIQDELIAREIVINDAESAVRYKLTKRQTQEEIQKCTGAVVITRGKYRPPNALPDGEKPLYLHISAGSHLKDTVDRIKAVDHAAAMVEEMLKQGPVNIGVKVPQPPSTCVFLGFDAEPSWNIAARIRGPNDQYVNHIMNETGATVLLKGNGSGTSESPNVEEEQQPLHLVLSSHNPKSLEHAKLLAENLLETISQEFGASRVSSSKVYGAVPPPQQLLAGVQSIWSEQKANSGTASGLTSSAGSSIPVPPAFTVAPPGVTSVFSWDTMSQSAGLTSGHAQANTICYSKPSLTGATSYSGYGGIYPQATPLQQVALALRQTPSPVSVGIAPAPSAGTISKSSMSSSEKEKQTSHRRKFQELPVASKVSTSPHQGSKHLKANEPITELGVRNISTMPAPKKLVQPSNNRMPPPFIKEMPPPPPPPKFNSSSPATKVPENNKFLIQSELETVPDTLVKLMEYGDEDDDLEEDIEEPSRGNSNVKVASKPFWAV